LSGIPRAGRVALAAASGALYAVSFPDASVGPLVFAALAPFLLALDGAGAREGAVLGFAHGIAAFGIGVSWIREVSLPGLVILLVILSLYPALFGALASLAAGRRGIARAAILAALWVGIDTLRLWLFSGFPFLFPAYALYRSVTLVQAADLAGFEGVSFAVVLSNGLVAGAIRLLLRTERTGALFHALGAAAIPLSLLGYGLVRLASLPLEPGPRFLAVQPNVPQGMKHDSLSASDIWRRQVRLTEEGIRAAGEVDLVVWAETMFPFTIDDNDPAARDESLALLGREIAVRHRTSFLVGANAVGAGDRDDRSYAHVEWNRALLFDAAGRLAGTYDKQHLVPSGEYVPLRGYLPFQDAIDDYVQSVNGFFPNLTPGTRTTVFEIGTRAGTCRFAALVCYEILFPYLAREARTGGADVLVNISNDGWWGRSSQLEQCVAISAFRAVETRMAVFRATNTGVSCWIDPAGRVRERLRAEGRDREVTGTLAAALETCPVVPPAVALGPFSGPAAGAAGLVLALALARRERADRRRAATAARKP